MGARVLDRGLRHNDHNHADSEWDAGGEPGICIIVLSCVQWNEFYSPAQSPFSFRDHPTPSPHVSPRHRAVTEPPGLMHVLCAISMWVLRGGKVGGAGWLRRKGWEWPFVDSK